MKHFYPREESSVSQYAMETPARASRNVMDRSRKLRAKKVVFSSLCCLVSRFVSRRFNLWRGHCTYVQFRGATLSHNALLPRSLNFFSFFFFIFCHRMNPLFVSTPPDEKDTTLEQQPLSSFNLTIRRRQRDDSLEYYTGWPLKNWRAWKSRNLFIFNLCFLFLFL